MGIIADFGLESWWLSELSEDSRVFLEALHGPLSSQQRNASHLDDEASVSATAFLTSLTVWLTPRDRRLGLQILSQAEAMQDTASILDRHFMYGRMIELYSRERETDRVWRNAMIQACEGQIAIGALAICRFREEHTRALASYVDSRDSERYRFRAPKHLGYERLTRIGEQKGAYLEALRLAQQANREGWSGTWEQSIARCRRKLATSGTLPHSLGACPGQPSG